jgi:hypothetical protein
MPFYGINPIKRFAYGVQSEKMNLLDGNGPPTDSTKEWQMHKLLKEISGASIVLHQWQNQADWMWVWFEGDYMAHLFNTEGEEVDALSVDCTLPVVEIEAFIKAEANSPDWYLV